jgi:hypothetical protein
LAAEVLTWRCVLCGLQAAAAPQQAQPGPEVEMTEEEAAAAANKKEVRTMPAGGSSGSLTSAQRLWMQQ